MNNAQLKHRRTYSTEAAGHFDESTAASSSDTPFTSVPPSPSTPSSRGRQNSVDTTSQSDTTNLPSAQESSDKRRRSKKSSFGLSRMASILPRVGNGYKRVDGGAAGQDGRVRFGWKKFTIGAVVVIGLVWIFGPRERRESVLSSVGPACECSIFLSIHRA